MGSDAWAGEPGLWWRVLRNVSFRPADPSLGAVGAGSNAGPHFYLGQWDAWAALLRWIFSPSRSTS